jgi:hypothetical protein
MATPKTGQDIDSFCRKCDLLLAHVIIAMNGSAVAKVECKTCRSIHAHKAEKKAAASTKTARAGSEKSRSSKSSSSRTKKALSAGMDYADMMRGQDLSRALRYKPQSLFEEGHILDHPTFGLGVVTKLLDDGKIDVLFPIGSKVLIHNRV